MHSSPLAFEAAYQPTYFCYGQSETLTWAMATGGVMLFLAYAAMPVLVFLSPTLRQLRLWVRLMVSLVFVLSGLAQMIVVLNVWLASYWVEAVEKNVAGVVSLLMVLLVGLAMYDGRSRTSPPVNSEIR